MNSLTVVLLVFNAIILLILYGLYKYLQGQGIDMFEDTRNDKKEP